MNGEPYCIASLTEDLAGRGATISWRLLRAPQYRAVRSR